MSDLSIQQYGQNYVHVDSSVSGSAEAYLIDFCVNRIIEHHKIY